MIPYGCEAEINLLKIVRQSLEKAIAATYKANRFLKYWERDSQNIFINTNQIRFEEIQTGLKNYLDTLNEMLEERELRETYQEQ